MTRAVVLLVALVSLLVPDISEAKSVSVPVISIESYTASPQWWEPKLIHAGILVLHASERLSNGVAHVTRWDGSEFDVRDVWECTKSGCEWEQWVGEDVQGVWFDTLATWVDWGPWHLNAAHNGVSLWQNYTYVDIYPNWLPNHTWLIEFWPTWASKQMPWPAILMIDGSCGTQVLELDPYWEGSAYTSTLVTDKIEMVHWTLTHYNGDVIARGDMSGPSCPAFRTFLPAIYR